MKKWIILFALLPSLFYYQNQAFAQPERQNNTNKIIPAKGDLNILILFAQNVNAKIPIAYSDQWSNERLPSWAGYIVSADGSKPKFLSSFFKESSFGKFNVNGDYFPQLLKLESSCLPGIPQILQEIGDITSSQAFKTSNGMKAAWFDKLVADPEYAPSLIYGKTSTTKPDHVMVIIHGPMPDCYLTGYGAGLQVFGLEADSWSVVTSDGRMPIAGMKAALGELMLGTYPGITITQGLKNVGDRAWALASPGIALFQAINAYERSIMNWSNDENKSGIFCLNREGDPVNSDLDAQDSNFEGVYILRDFVTSGDALRIKLPFRDAKGNKQYIWLENHLTSAINMSMFDQFENSCKDAHNIAQKGVYAYLQSGDYNLSTYSDVSLIQLPASGYSNYSQARERYTALALSINSNDDYCNQKYEFAFRPNGIRAMNIGTNPSSSVPEMHSSKEQLPGRFIYLNGVAVELIKEHQDGAIEILVVFDETWIGNNVEWCADSIVIPSVRNYEIYSIGLAKGKQIKLQALRSDGNTVVRSTQMLMLPGSILYMEENSVLHLERGTAIVLYPGSKLILKEGASVNIMDGGKLEIMSGAKIILPDKRGINLDKGAILYTDALSIVSLDGKIHKIRGSTNVN